VDSENAWTQLLALSSASGELDEEAAEPLVHLLHQSGEAVDVEWALPVLADPIPARRQVAAWVLGQLGYEKGRPFGERVMPALADAARVERDDDTRQALVAAIGHAEDPVWVPELLRHAGDDYPSVRQGIAGALPIMFRGDEMSANAVTALITLTRDTDPDVRDWATFSLGSQSRADDDAIRDALAARLDDDEGDTRFEAALGLARRGDPRALSAVSRRLEDETATIYLLDLAAAAELADPVLLPTLNTLRLKWATDKDAHTVAVDYAITRCEPATHDLAKALAAQFTDRVNHAVLDIGWTIESSGDYPLTVLTVRRPDGHLSTNHDGTMLWDGVSPTEFNIAQEAESWSNAVRDMAAESSGDG